MLHPLPLPALPLPRADRAPPIPGHRRQTFPGNRGDRGGAAGTSRGKIKVRISGGDRTPRGPTVDSTPTEPEPHHQPSRPENITATVTAAKWRSLSYSGDQGHGNLIRINSTQTDDRLLASVFNTQSAGPKEK